MSAVLAVLVVILVLLVVGAAYALGVADTRLHDDVTSARRQGLAARRAIHDQVRSSFVAMAEEAERRRRP